MPYTRMKSTLEGSRPAAAHGQSHWRDGERVPSSSWSSSGMSSRRSDVIVNVVISSSSVLLAEAIHRLPLLRQLAPQISETPVISRNELFVLPFLFHFVHDHCHGATAIRAQFPPCLTRLTQGVESCRQRISGRRATWFGRDTRPLCCP
jgi:hypothetical protein